MAQTKKEATRLVYVEGIPLDSALEMSKTYKNIIFLTDDNKKSNELTANEKIIDDSLVASQENGYINDNWDIGLNIVRNGRKYIVVRGINSEHSSFIADGTKYTLRIDQHGLLYLDTNEISERFIYIGNKAVDDDGEFMYDIESIKNAVQNNTVESVNCIKKSYIISQTQKKIGRKTVFEKFVYLVIVQNNNAKDEYGYIWLFSDLQTLKEATTYVKTLGTVIGPHSNENRQGWTSETKTIDEQIVTSSTPINDDIDSLPQYDNNFGLNTVFGIDMDETSFWSKDDYRKLYVLIPETYENNIHITNTLSTNKEESEDSGILNNNLFNAFRLETTYTREQNLPITINYNKSRYHEYTFDYKVRSVGFVIE